MEAPVLGAISGDCSKPQRWQLTTSFRHMRSDRHFVGTDPQEERTHEGSQVINTVNQVELGLKYTKGPRWSFALNVPYIDTNRSFALRNSAREIIARSAVQSDGAGDITLLARRWMLEPKSHPNGNLSLGLGVKLPTGHDDVRDWRKRVQNDVIVRNYEFVDQSIQPGDGGLGFILDLQGYVHIVPQRFAWYGSATYLFNPECTDFVPTHRGAENEKYNSIADQYLARTGFAFSVPKWRRTTFGIGGRWEGVPVHDAFGSSKWFRRPGYGVMIEPWWAWSGAVHSVTIAVPYGVERNRMRSEPDREADRHGDAAFADWVFLASYGYKFGGGAKKAETLP
jgi:hypothetical protein